MDRLRRWVDGVDRLSDRIGRGMAWLSLATVALVFLSVVLRYLFNWGQIWLQETYTALHAAAFMLGAAYALRHDAHVRIDIFYRTASPRYRALVDLFGSLLLLLPMLAVLLWAGLPYVAKSVATLEGSREPGGLPGLFVLKALIPTFAALLLLQGSAEVGRAILRLKGRWPERRATESGA
ncbi:MAG: TRAP transporter small permease subunit [Geminicoccaceae bacterium]